MTMFYYRNEDDKNLTGGGKKWTPNVETKNGKKGTERLIVCQKTNNDNKPVKYVVGEFHNWEKESKCYKWDVRCSGKIYYSFDYTSYNFHIVPCENKEVRDNVDNKLREVMIAIARYLYTSLKHHAECCEEKSRNKIVITAENHSIEMLVSGGSPPHTKNHRYLKINRGDYEYLISFNRLSCKVSCKYNYIHNHFGHVQFYQYPVRDGHINKFKDDKENPFKMMYPKTAEDKEKSWRNHCVYNPPGLTIESSVANIAEAFIGFIEENR